MIGISWQQFDRNQAAKDVSFEGFCYQVAFTLYHEFGYFENYFNTPGSEFYLHLEKDCPALGAKVGDIIGWQAKWWMDSEDSTKMQANRQAELLKNFKTTLTSRKIKKWIICTPGDVSQTAANNLKTKLKAVSATTKIEFWSKTAFNNFRAANFELLGPVFHHYFNELFLGFAEIESYSKARIKHLEQKFDTDLYTPSQNDDDLFFLIDFKAIFYDLQLRARYLQDAVARIEKWKLPKATEFEDLTDEYVKEGLALFKICVDTANKTHEILSKPLTLDSCRTLGRYMEEQADKYRLIAVSFDKKQKRKEHLKDPKEVEQKAMWRFTDAVLEPIFELRNHLYHKRSRYHDEQEEDGIFDVLLQLFQNDVHILSSAGFGKTNIACNLCNALLQKQIPCLLLLGSSFRSIALPQQTIPELLQWSSKYDFKQLLGALNNLGFFKGYKIPIIIDGLNESTPFDGIWKTNIKDIITEIDKYDYLILVTTCRDLYINAIFEVEDVHQIPNTLTLVGLRDSTLEKAIRKYFNKYKIAPKSWSFNQDHFSNPLLLKIFSEVNQNQKNVAISLNSLYKSLEKYLDRIEAQASIVNSKADPVLRQKIKKGILAFSKKLWETGERAIPLLEFHELIDPSAREFAGSLSEKLLDEGLCFQKNLDGSNEMVQFTYDVVAGYCIAARYLLPELKFTSGVFGNTTIAAELQQKALGNIADHSLQQDIRAAMIHLFSDKYNTELFEIVDSPKVIEETLNNIDYIIDRKEVQDKLFDRLSGEKTNTANFKLLFEKLFEAIYKKKIHGLGSFTLRVLAGLNQVTIDNNWTELFRKYRGEVDHILLSINKAYRWDKLQLQSPSDDIYTSLLATGSIDKPIRSTATENVYLTVCKLREQAFSVCEETLLIKDISVIESMIAGICGSVLTIKQPDYTEKVLAFISKTFIPKFKSTHICVVDYIQTIAEFAQHQEIKKIPALRFKKTSFKINKDKEVLKGRDGRINTEWPDSIAIDLYDFGKYQVDGISSSGYRKLSSVNKTDCLAIILNHVRTKGLNDKSKKEMQIAYKEPEERSYPRKLQGSYSEYAKKYLWQSYYEFTGYLFLTKNIKDDEDFPRYRSSYTVFDPTFPRMPKRFQLIPESFLPEAVGKVQSWIKQSNTNAINAYYQHSLYSKDEWVMLTASINQQGEVTNARWQVYLDAFLIPKGKVNAFASALKRGQFNYNNNGMSHVFAGEIGWSPFSFSSDSSYWMRPFLMNSLVQTYGWSSWSGERDSTPNFQFLRPEIANLLELSFDVTELAFFDKQGKQATMIVWTEKQLLFFLRRDMVDVLTRKKRKKLILYEYLTKYGNYERRDKDMKLNPSRQDIQTLRQYPDFKTVIAIKIDPA